MDAREFIRVGMSERTLVVLPEALLSARDGRREQTFETSRGY